jgi:hypothetical protein
MSKRVCLICNSPMKLTVTFGLKKSKTGGNKYRLRRFNCTVCDYSEMIAGDGTQDDKDGERAIGQINNLYKEQEDYIRP